MTMLYWFLSLDIIRDWVNSIATHRYEWAEPGGECMLKRLKILIGDRNIIDIEISCENAVDTTDTEIIDLYVDQFTQLVATTDDLIRMQVLENKSIYSESMWQYIVFLFVFNSQNRKITCAWSCMLLMKFRRYAILLFSSRTSTQSDHSLLE